MILTDSNFHQMEELLRASSAAPSDGEACQTTPHLGLSSHSPDVPRDL